MADRSQASEKLKRLEAENRKLKAENKRLQTLAVSSGTATRRSWAWLRTVGVVLFMALAVAGVVTATVLFWVGNTVVKSDRFASTTEPVIKDREVQKAIAGYTTAQLYANVDVEDVITSALPPRADFLAPTITSQLQSHTDEALQNILARPQFQERWNTLQVRAHDRFITAVERHGGDGVIDLNDVYQQLSGELKQTKLAFLADKPLPPRVGSVTIASGQGLTVLNRVITQIDLWRTLVVLVLLASAVAAIWLSRHRRRSVIVLGLITATCLLALLIGLRITREIIAGRVQPEYAEGVRHATQIVFQPLVVQTTTLLVTFLLIVFVAWVSGASRSALAFKARTSDLFAGRLHSALFGARENGFTSWLGAHKRVVQWLIVASVFVVTLFVRLTPGTLLACVAVLLALVLAVEILAAPSRRARQSV